MKSFDPSNRHAIRRAWIIHSLVGLLYACLVCAIFHPWLRPFHQPQRGGPELQFRAGDLTPLFSVWTQIAARSIFEHGDWPLWSDHIYCGEPFFAKPQVAVISLTTLLCALLPAQVVATWTFLLHLWIAGMATYAWCLESGATLRVASSRLGESCHSTCVANYLAAACGGAVFMLSGLMVEHTMIGHGPIVLVACWMPLVLRAIGRALAGGRPVRAAAVAGTLVAVQLLAGGETMFLYNVVAGALIGLAWLVCGRSSGVEQSEVRSPAPATLGPAMLRLIVIGGVIGTVGFGLSAIKLLPGLELMPLTNRAGGLALADAAAPIIEFTEPAVLGALTFGPRTLQDARHLFAGTCALAIVGMIAGGRSRETRWLAFAGAVLVVVGVAIAHSQTIFGMLWASLPMFKYQRIPQRALVLAYVGLGLLVALGVRRVLESHRMRGTIARCLAGLVLIGIVAGEALVAVPQLPPTADIRREIRSNQLLNHVAAEAGLFRVHAWESTDRNWGVEHVSVPLGLSNLAGWDHLWLRDYLGAEGTVGRDVMPFLTASYLAQHRERFWGMMNVRFVSAMQPLERPWLTLIRRFPPCKECQPAKSAGPYLYENIEWLPRAWVAPRGVLVSGEPGVVYQLLDHPSFNPRRIVALAAEGDDLGQYQALDAFIVPSSPNVLTTQRDQFRARNLWLLTYSTQNLGLWQQPDELAEMLEDLMSLDPEPKAPVVETYRPQFIRLRLSGQTGFLVLAEKFAHFPGWQVRTASGPRTLLRANGVASAITLDGTEQWVELTYWPTTFARGLGITLASLVLVPLIGWFGDRLLHV